MSPVEKVFSEFFMLYTLENVVYIDYYRVVN